MRWKDLNQGSVIWVALQEHGSCVTASIQRMRKAAKQKRGSKAPQSLILLAQNISRSNNFRC